VSIDDVGNLADYELNGDNYEQVSPDGTTLVIPTNYQNQIVVPSALCATDSLDPNCVPGPSNYWNALDPSCVDDTVYCIAHDATTKGFYIALNCQYSFDEGDANTCYENCAAYLASIDGTELLNLVPGWLIEILYPNALLSELPVLDIDYFFLACAGEAFFIQPPGPTQPTQPAPPPAPCCTSYSFWGAGCCIK
jgi:hypothetical protein